MKSVIGVIVGLVVLAHTHNFLIAAVAGGVASFLAGGIGKKG
jgi:hypothetical protein